MSNKRDELLEMHAFVRARVAERVRSARDSEDNLAASFDSGTLGMLELLRVDIVERPWASAELANFLLRMAHRYRRHPDHRW